MSEIYKIGEIKLDLSPEILENVSAGKLRNLRVAYREAVRITINDDDLEPKNDIQHDSKKMTALELARYIKEYVNDIGQSRIIFILPEYFKPAKMNCVN